MSIRLGTSGLPKANVRQSSREVILRDRRPLLVDLQGPAFVPRAGGRRPDAPARGAAGRDAADGDLPL
jgi:hypothetical protein